METEKSLREREAESDRERVDGGLRSGMTLEREATESPRPELSGGGDRKKRIGLLGFKIWVG